MKNRCILIAFCCLSLYGYSQELSKSAKEKIMFNNILIVSKSIISGYILDLTLSDVVGKKVEVEKHYYKNVFGKMVLDDDIDKGIVLRCSFDEQKIEYDIDGAIFIGDWRDSLVIQQQECILFIPKNNNSTTIKVYAYDGSPRSDRKIKFDAQGRIVEYQSYRYTYTQNHIISSITDISYPGFGNIPATVASWRKYNWQGKKLLSIEDDNLPFNNSTIAFYDTDSVNTGGLWTMMTSYAKNQEFADGKKRVVQISRHFITFEEEAKQKQLEKEIAEEEARQTEIRIKEEKRVLLERRIIESKDEDPYITADIMPQFLGGDILAFRNWVESKIVYPSYARSRGIQGRVKVTFVVEVDGSISEIGIIDSPDKSLSDEVIRIINSSPKWTSGEIRDIPVKVLREIAVSFRLPN